MPKSEEAKLAWNKWVEAMATRYLGKVHEWEIWNEPDLSEEIPAEDIVDMNIRTAEIIKKVDPKARIAGFAFCTLNGKLLEDCLKLVEKEGKLNLFHWISYHGYEYRPENSYKAVMNFRRIIDKYALAFSYVKVRMVLLRKGIWGERLITMIGLKCHS